MTRTRSAGFVYGAPLPTCLIPAGAACDDPTTGGQAGENATGGDGQGEGSSDGAGGSSADDAGSQAGESGQGSAGDADEWDDDEEVQSVPKLKKLHDEAKEWRHKYRRLEAEMAERGEPADVDALRIQAEFFKHAARDVVDLDAAMKLADLSAVTINDDGNVTGMADAVAEVCRQYPFLADDPDAWDEDPRTRTTDVPAESGSGGSPSNRRRPAGGRSNTPKALMEKFPALYDRRR